MYGEFYAMKTIIYVLIAVALLVCFCSVAVFVFEPYFAVSEAVANAYAGEVIDKKIINAQSGLFTSSDIDYRLVIKVEYEFKGKFKETQKSISVDKETYQQANIGDWFDSHTLEVIKNQ